MQGHEGFQVLTFQFGFIPYELINSRELIPELAISPYFTAISSMFMHGGWMHLIGNMLFLWIFGNNVEDYFGPIKFIIFYLVSGLAAIALFTIFGPNSQIPLVGASGAIAGLMGAYIVLHPRARVTVLVILFFIQFVVLPAKVVLGIWFFIQLLLSFSGSSTGGGVAYLAHVGGFVFGWGLLKLLVKIRGRGVTPSSGQRVYRMRW
ncbi:MAG: rhomboid family intramembrane serine protease [candidate division Zixibacteria bacterium]|nr:rhomboid family intramembrane serine protease [candidate division Zixibacteria bacterium]